MRASMLAKYVSGADSPIERRCAFVGHLRNAANAAAVIELFVFIINRFCRIFGGHDTQSVAPPNQSKAANIKGNNPGARLR
jgi:hypothetical protein